MQSCNADEREFFMPVDDQPRRYSTSKSGVIPRSLYEPPEPREPVRPPTLPEIHLLDGATTGVFTVVSEGFDNSAVGDDDNLQEAQQ